MLFVTRRMRLLLLSGFVGFLACGVAFAQSDLRVTEVMWKSTHPERDPNTLLGGLAEGDWFEIYNSGTEPINLGGYLFDDSDELFGFDYAIFPNFEIQAGEVIVVLREDCPDGWRSAWDAGNDFGDLRIITEDMMDPLSGDSFSGLSSGGGDSLNLYAPTAIDSEGFPTGEPALVTIDLPAANFGFSWQWDSEGNFLGDAEGNVGGFSTLGVNGSYEAVNDGSELPPPYAALDIASPGYVEGIGAPRFPDQPQLPCIDGAPGDFDSNEIYECADVDALVTEIVAGTNNVDFDLTGDELVNTDDLAAWLAEAGAFNNSTGGAYLPGDANLDGSVDVGDFNIWNNNKFTNDAGWCGGDFNADGSVDVGDFNIWNNNKFSSSDVSVVPEPAGWMLAIIVLAPFLAKRRKSGIAV